MENVVNRLCEVPGCKLHGFALSEASVIRLAIVLVCQTLLIGFIQLKSPCQHVWGVNHWTKASYCGVVVLSVYTYLNGNGWVETPIPLQLYQQSKHYKVCIHVIFV